METRNPMLDVMGDMIDRSITVGMRPIVYGGEVVNHIKLYEAAYKKAGGPLTTGAAELLAERIKPGDFVILSAGFRVAPFMPFGESDGPGGVASIARGLALGLGARSVVVTDDACMPPIEAALKAATVRMLPYEYLKDMPKVAVTGTSIIPFPMDDDEAKSEAKRLCDELNPKAIITVERSDVNEKGIHHTGGGNDMGQWTAKVEHLIVEANSRGIVTIGILDLGNEIGGGNIHDEIKEIVIPKGAQCICGCGGGIAAVTPTTCTIMSSCSNKGAYGLMAALAHLTDKPEVLHDADMMQRIIEAVAAAGAVDGITMRTTLTEDGVPALISKCLIHELHWLIECARMKPDPEFTALRRDTGWYLK